MPHNILQYTICHSLHEPLFDAHGGLLLIQPQLPCASRKEQAQGHRTTGHGLFLQAIPMFQHFATSSCALTCALPRLLATVSRRGAEREGLRGGEGEKEGQREQPMDNYLKKRRSYFKAVMLSYQLCGLALVPPSLRHIVCCRGQRGLLLTIATINNSYY